MSTMERPSLSAWQFIRRWLLRLHLWIGIAFSIPFAILGLTGAFLVYDQDFETLPQATAIGTIASPGEILEAGETAFPGAKAAALSMPENAGEPAIVRLRGQGEGRRGAFGAQVFVDPVSLAVLGTRDSTRSPLRDWMHGMHGSFELGGETGRPIVGWLGVGMTFLGLTGLVLWWPRRGMWRNSIGIRKGARGFQLHRQLHITAGVLLWLVFVVVSFTGVAISFPTTIGGWFTGTFGGAPPGPRQVRVEPLDGPFTVTTEQAIDIARAAAPDANFTSVFLPGGADQPYRVTLVPNGALAGAPSVTAYVDPYRGTAFDVRDPRKAGLGSTLMAWQRTLHDGRAFGGVWAFLIFLSGLLPVLFSITGIAMWWMKRRARLTRRYASDPAAEGVAAE